MQKQSFPCYAQIMTINNGKSTKRPVQAHKVLKALRLCVVVVAYVIIPQIKFFAYISIYNINLIHNTKFAEY